MSQTIPTIPAVINELMFIAISQPESLVINVGYRSAIDYICISVLPRSFDISESDDAGYRAALLMNLNMPLYVPGALQTLIKAKEDLMKLTNNAMEKAA